MWFRKATDKQRDRAPVEEALTGHQAICSIEHMAGGVVVVHAVNDFSEITGGAPPETRIVEVETLPDVLATASGHALAGLRTSAVAASLAGIHESLRAAAGKRLPFVVHLTCKGQTRATGAMHGSHGDYYAAGDNGFFQLFARNVQEVADFALIARRVAERSLTPGISAQDFQATSHSVQDVRIPEHDLVVRYLGGTDDVIPSPTEAQTILFGPERRRVPILLDPDHPAGIGGVQDRESYFKGLAARRVYFADDISSTISEAMEAFGELTGRLYEMLPAYRVDDADVVVLAQGAVVEELQTVVDFLRETEKVKAGLINLSVYRPFPGAQLTRLLAGKKAVTVLERTDAAMAEDPPLMREVRAAVDKAAENGMAASSSRETPLHAGYAAYNGSNKRPLLLSGVYGVGRELPSFAELVTVYRNMLATGGTKSRFFVGAGTDQDTRRFPQLQMLQQRLARAYPGLKTLSLDATDRPVRPDLGDRATQLHSFAAQGALFAGNLLARTLAVSAGWHVRTFPEGGLDPNLQPATLTISYAVQSERAGGAPAEVDTILVADDRLLERLPSRHDVKKGATLIVGSARDAETFRERIGSRTARWIRDNELRVYVVDTPMIASDTTSHPAFVDQLMIWSLLGAWLRVTGDVPEAQRQRVMDDLQSSLSATLGDGDVRVGEITSALRRGSEELEECPRGAWSAEHPVRPEAEPPWTVREATGADETVFDPKRFWHSVGYLYDKGEAEQTLADPYVATGILPARSSAFRDMTPFRLQTPRWLPENCTACGLCWALCPESALPPTLHDVSSILEAAISEREKAGAVIVQLRRVSDPLAKQAYQLLAKNGANPSVTVGPLLREAFSTLLGKMNLKGDQLEALNQEFDPVCRLVERYPIAKSECFFDEPHKQEKGSGKLLSIVLNPSSCTGCGICVEECPDGALEWGDVEDRELEVLRQNAELQKLLPGVSRGFLDALVSETDLNTEIRRLLDPRSYWSLVGGDGSFPGNASKTAVHLVTATVESVMNARFDAYVDTLSQLIERVKAAIQGDVETVTKINDFEEFGRRLSQLNSSGLTTESLAELVGGDAASSRVNSARLKRLSRLLGSLEEQRRHYLGGGDGTGRARMVMTIDSENAALWNGTYPYNPHPHPWAHHLPGDAATLAAGVYEGMTRRFAEEFAVCRQAQIELDGGLGADAGGETLEPGQFTDEEHELIPPVIVLGSTHTSRWDAVSKLIATGLPIKIVMINTHGPSVIRRDPVVQGVMKAIGRDGAFVLQTSVGHPGHLIRGMAEGMATRRPALFHIHAPDPQANGIAPDRVAAQARLAHQSRAFPLFRFDPDADEPKLRLEETAGPEWVWPEHDLEVTEPSGGRSTLRLPLTAADWAVGEARFRKFFEVVSKGHLNDQMKPLSEYVGLAPEEREALTPFIHVIDGEDRHMLAVVSPEIVAATERIIGTWKDLCAMVGDSTTTPQEAPAAAVPVTPSAGETNIDAKVYERVTERLLALSGYGRDTEFFQRSLRDFLTREKEGEDEASAQ